MKTSLDRRRLLVRGLAGLTLAAGGGVVWRALDTGALQPGAGEAYAPWRDWRAANLAGPLAVVRAGVLAANAHNTQPWRFHLSEGQIEVFADYDRHLGSFDPFRRELNLSLGCALENMAHAAGAQGLTPKIGIAPGRMIVGTPPDHAAPAAIMRLERGAQTGSDLFQAIDRRHTHRGVYKTNEPIGKSDIDAMAQLADGENGVGVQFLHSGPLKARLGELTIETTQEISADHEMERDSIRWYRLSPQAIGEHRDGVTIDAFGLPPVVNAAAKMLPTPGGDSGKHWLTATRDVHIATAALFGMIIVDDLYDRAAALSAGRLWQRLHLWATAHGIAAQPLNQLPEMVDREMQLGKAPRAAGMLASVTEGARWRPTFVFRMGYAERAPRLSPRRDIGAVTMA